MAKIEDGNSSTLLEVGTNNNAARVQLFDSSGRALSKDEVGSYQARIEVLPTTLPAGTTYFAMRNAAGSGKLALVNSIMINTGFAGAAAVSRSIFEIVRFSSATPTGGTQITAGKKNTNSDPDSAVTDIRFAPAGLTTTGVVFSTDPIALIGVANQLTVGNNMEMILTEPIILAPGEGLAFRANGAIVAGAAVLGAIGWYERAE